MKEALDNILLNLKEEEACKSMIDRLYGRSSTSNAHPDKKKSTGFKKNIRKSELDRQEEKSQKSTVSDSCSKVNKELADKLVESCNWLLEADILNIYSMKKEEVRAILPQASAIVKKINKGREAEDLLPDLQQEDLAEEEESLQKRSRNNKFGTDLVEFDDDDADSDDDRRARRPRKVKVVEGPDGSVNAFAVPASRESLAFKKPPTRVVPSGEASMEEEEEITRFVKSVEKPLPKVDVRPLAVQSVDATKLFGSSKLEQDLKSAIAKSKAPSQDEEDDDNIF